ncbi:putative C24B11.05 [Gossypium arboreum]|uniref:Uncharacterized protein n=3 Tax=Gossypium TaxID=3633 RepID=A0ABR0R6F9_GOSAR|nr:suppressor of disruption of TFIIS-like [Gossypium arboreum]TYI35213.1 hypothetical protein ES332_A03G060300v1 [Gossypium tomentosum]KAK5846727.1 hypothetical protein PVK06_003024 [Gossypium arboreum]KHG06579.1 putative C24B11.05 [Gossypium arboreum]TYI35214.1 hypothetical protein ES332_A03G060300v1 [Gossypium tomentosum]TYI35215.1 hypothetical protein ES332_A03G060300v1 [Gossypium tomentosum]
MLLFPCPYSLYKPSSSPLFIYLSPTAYLYPFHIYIFQGLFAFHCSYSCSLAEIMEYENQYQHVAAPKYDCLLFDVDDTLYPLSSGLSKACTTNIQEFMIEKLGIEGDKVSEINRVLYRNYGTSMAGLRAIGYNFNYDEYHSFVHGRLPYENLKPDYVLRNLLLSLPIRKVIFSNGDEVHVAKVLKKLGLEGCFERVISFDTLNSTNGSHSSDDEESSKLRDTSAEILDANSGPSTPIICKPFKNAFEQAFKIANINPQKTLFFDDSIRNIQSGKEIGLHTVLVGTSHRTNGADYALESIHNIREALPELWESDAKKPESVKLAIQTSVMA